jgi:flagellar L-ring protein precursor FlgH
MNTLFDRRAHILAVLAVATLSGACAIIPEADEPYQPPPSVQQVFEPPTSGAIYQAGAEVRLFEDLKAGRVGDILTVRLIERTDASKNSSTSTSKATEASLGNPAIFGRPVTLGGNALFEGSLSGDHSFDGAGSSSQSNSLQGDITVTVIERLANGNLRIAGEKWVTINQGKEFIRLSGIIRPYDIEPDNSLLSGKVADAQITYSSKGVMAAANRRGLFARFFQSIFSGY